MLWGLFAIDGLLARAADDQRQVSADYVEAIVQQAVDDPTTRRLSERGRLEQSLAAAVSDTRRPARAVGVLIAVGDTVFSPASARTLFTTGATTERSLR